MRACVHEYVRVGMCVCVYACVRVCMHEVDQLYDR